MPKSSGRHAEQGEPPRSGDLVTGIFQSARNRGGFLVPDRPGIADLRIPPTGLGAALHGDQVQARVTHAKEGRQARGEIIRILRHAHKRMVGRITHLARLSVVQPKNSKIQRKVEIHRRLDPREIPQDSWVIVEIHGWSEHPDQPLLGKVVEVLGADDDKGLPVLLLVREKGVEIEFTPEVEREAAALETRPPEDDSRLPRRDLRNDRICTIDPATAKDFDDAISLVAVSENGWRIGVHIADVAHYVRPGTALDAEAHERATSIYPVDRVIPMLPEALSNRLCSLRPGEDKLTMSAEFDVDRAGGVSNVECYASTIHSMRRFAYEEVQGLFDEADLAAGRLAQPPPTPRPRPVIPEALHHDLMEIRQASRAIGDARRRRGALELELPEAEVLFDADGRVSDLRRREHFEAHSLIEELMIAANEAVARELERAGYPALFRVHGEPDEAALGGLAPVLTHLGIPVPARGGMSREQLQSALHKARKHPAGSIVQRWVLRAMARAVYQPENIGHFGLASESYVHFTSPIRRYPDLVIHRLLKMLLRGEAAAADGLTALRADLPLLGRHTSAREQRSQHIEWDAEKLLGLQFMRRYLGDIFECYVSGVSPMGLFVELKDYPVEGLVRVRDLDDDYYELDESRHLWQGRRTGRSFTIGDPLTVMIERIDVLAGQMDLILVRGKKGKGDRGKPRKGQRPPIYQRRKSKR